ncbi:hypothetical protein DL96DRAFT_586396 [Flagelloscypha sp. PMI_526]|nr:hypothetical protein DL96DRAFT_586396 [Flagelloscypha sp. PMI_526]
MDRLPLPLDTLREMIEWAAESDWSLQTASALSLVSKGVQFWSDKYLFQNIVIYEDRVPKKMSAFLLDFIQEDRSPRYELARFHVRRFATRATGHSKDLVKFISHCPNLFTICLWNEWIRNRLLNKPLPSLRRLTFSSCRSVSSLSFRSPIFQTVTHLALVPFYITKWHKFFSNGLSTMPALQYLILYGNDRYGALPTPSDMLELSQNIAPSIRVLAVTIDGLVDPSLMEGNLDPRIIIVTDRLKWSDEDTENPFVEITNNIGFQSWTGERLEEESIWAQIERIYHARQQLRLS